MTTLYRPVPIESAEQAERLPQNALLFGGHLDDPWDVTTFFRDPDEGCPAVMLDALAAGVRVTALVPVEAEEEVSDKVVSAVANELRYRVLPDTLEGVVREVLSTLRLVTPLGGSMAPDNFTEAARAEAERRAPLDGHTAPALTQERAGLVAMAEWARDHLARVRRDAAREAAQMIRDACDRWEVDGDDERLVNEVLDPWTSRVLNPEETP